MPKKRNISKRPQAARLTRSRAAGTTWALAVVLGLAFVVRVGVFFLMPAGLSDDPDGYWRLAENIAQHGTLGHAEVPSAFRPPVYPLLLAPCAMLGNDWGKAGVAALHVAMGVATVWLVFVLAVRLGLKRYAAIAGLLTAFDPILLNQSTLIMTETTAAFLATAALFAIDDVIRRPTVIRAVIFGLVSGVAVLCRPVFLPWMVLSTVMLFFVLRRRGDEPLRKEKAATTATALKAVLSAAVAACIVLAPWAIRNQIQFKRPILTTTHGGYTFYLANNPWFYGYLAAAPPGSVWDAQELGPRWHRLPDEFSPEVELSDDREAYEAAFATIGDEPGMFLYSCLVRVGRLWAVAPHQVSARRLIGVWYCVEYFLAALGVWAICRNKSARQPLWLWMLLLAVCVTGVHVFYWTNMRMRAPLEPVIALAAAAGCLSLPFRRG